VRSFTERGLVKSWKGFMSKELEINGITEKVQQAEWFCFK
jgi:hypothetical protein